MGMGESYPSDSEYSNLIVISPSDSTLKSLYDCTLACKSSRSTPSDKLEPLNPIPILKWCHNVDVSTIIYIGMRANL